MLINCRSFTAYKIWRKPIQPCTSESKIKGKTDYHTRTALCWWCCTRSSARPGYSSAQLLNQFSSACSEFALTISLKTTKVLSQGTDIQPTIKIEDNYIKNVKNCVYLGSSIASNASKDTEINCHIGKVSGTFSQLSVRVWDDPKLAIRTKLTGYCACVCSTLLYGSKM